MATVVIGIGNPVLTDDGVGVQAVRRVAEELAGSPGVATLEVYSGGLRLMEAMAGYDRAILIDAVVTPGGRPGSVYRLPLAGLWETRNSRSTHDAALAVALEFGRLAGLRLPAEVSVWAVEAGDTETFGERLTEPVERAVPMVVAGVLRELESRQGACV